MSGSSQKILNTKYEHIHWEKWSGFLSHEFIQNQCREILKYVENSDIQYTLIDLRQAQGTFVHSIKVLRDFFRELNFEGITKSAFLLSKNHGMLIHAAELVFLDNCYIESQLFFEEENAFKWFDNWIANPNRTKIVNCNKLVVQKNKQNVYIELSKIIFAAADGHSCNVHTLEDVYRVNYSLKELNKNLPKGQFQRIHKSYVVNIARIKKIAHETNYSSIIHIEDLPNIKIPIGKKYLQKCKRILKF